MDPNINTLRRAFAPRLQTIASGAPDVYATLVGAWAASAAAIDGAVLAAIRDRIEKILGAESVPAATTDTPELAFIDQFVDYVADVDEQLRAPLLGKYGKAGLRNFVEAVYIADQSVRLSLTHEQLFTPVDDLAAPPEPDHVLTPTRANMKWHDEILAHDGLDNLTREVIRIRTGWYHQCGLCNSCRLVEGDRVVVDSEMETRILSYEQGSMSAPHTAALRYADAHMVEPAGLSQALADELRMHFSDTELLQLTIEVSSWNYQKVLVALAIDPPLNSEGLTAFTIGRNGSIQIGNPLAPVH
ncbi:carboxymuconolactone decarboxylase family protein [Rhodococcus sp. JVH1]|uniref:carboxymuconolactone decarboxylase family protein n=1 Tax=Rhodococcus sp. JVH1 TaxID=745408 RepID=UPI0002721810|nr:hypothetical protein [Rhodococcus sp. JVH1]EJI95769.1 hypothetical protein JVH1_6790 [Rhodococcus sp. JVH1]